MGSTFGISHFKSVGIKDRYRMSDFYGDYSAADFNTAFPISAANEAGYVNDPNDAGGETYRGIARNYNPGWAGWKIIDAYKIANGVPAKGFTNPDWDAAAFAFYKTTFWDKLMLDNINDQENANQIYDHTLSGLPRTVTMVKDVLNQKFGYNLGLGTTMDQATVAAVNAVDQQAFHDAFKQARADFFTYSAAALAPADSVYFPIFKQFNPTPNPGNSRYLKGWLNRVNKYAYTTAGKAIAAIEVAAYENPMAFNLIMGGMTAAIVFSFYFLLFNKSKNE